MPACRPPRLRSFRDTLGGDSNERGGRRTATHSEQRGAHLSRPHVPASRLICRSRRHLNGGPGRSRVGERRPSRAACSPDWLGFLPPPPRSVRAVLPHTALRRSHRRHSAFRRAPGPVGRGATMVVLRDSRASISRAPAPRGNLTGSGACGTRGRRFLMGSSRLYPPVRSRCAHRGREPESRR
jgi:hypothetical protein